MVLEELEGAEHTGKEQGDGGDDEQRNRGRDAPDGHADRDHREFAAPKHLVYRAYTEPDLIARWWSGERGEVTSVDVDLRVGGTWRYVMTANEGFEVAFHGEFREIVPNERLVNTEVYEMPDDFPSREHPRRRRGR